MRICHLPAESIDLITQIDRSEYVDYAYRVVDGKLERYDVEWDVPTFRTEGSGGHTLHSQINKWRPVVEGGGTLLAAFAGEQLAGICLVVAELEPQMAWLAYVHVTRAYRRRGVGGRLWDEAEGIAREREATSIYLSAVPSGPAIDFYVGHGCQPVEEPHPELFAKEPEDIHLIKRL